MEQVQERKQYVAAAVGKPAFDDGAVASVYQAYMSKLKFERDMAEWEQLPAAKKLSVSKPRDSFKKFSSNELRFMLPDAFEAAHPELNTVAAGDRGPAVLTVKAELSVLDRDSLVSFVHTQDNDRRLFHEEHHRYEKAGESLGRKDVSVSLDEHLRPFSSRLSRRMDDKAFFSRFYERFDKAVGSVRRECSKPRKTAEIALQLEKLKIWQADYDKKRSFLFEERRRLEAEPSLVVDSLDGYIRRSLELRQMRRSFLEYPQKNTEKARLEYQLRENKLYAYRQNELPEALAKQTREKNPSGKTLGQIMEFTKQEFVQINHHDWTEERYTDVCYSKFVENARTDGYSPESIFSAIRSDADYSGIRHSKLDSRSVMTLSSQVDERLINGLDRHVEGSVGMSVSCPAMNAGLVSSMEAVSAGLGHTALADAFVRRMENPELYMVSSETALLNPAVILRDDMSGVAILLAKNGDLGTLGTFLHDAGVSFRDGAGNGECLGEAAARMYGNGSVEDVTRVEGFRNTWADLLKRARKALRPEEKTKKIPFKGIGMGM